MESSRKVNSYFTTHDDYGIINAEVLFSEFVVEHGLPITVMNHGGKLFQKMFPDSQIAKCILARTKTSHHKHSWGKTGSIK